MSLSVQDNTSAAALAARLSKESRSLDLRGRLMEARAEISGRMVFTTSFGIEDQAITHAIFTDALEIDVVTLDTGRLFPETIQVWSDTERHYGRRIPIPWGKHTSGRKRTRAVGPNRGVSSLASSGGFAFVCASLFSRRMQRKA
jgi:3'-phosphoadenosine 5'-phosphosulfate sulfotransferase (PAPS reductase)/FAD synthetase